METIILRHAIGRFSDQLYSAAMYVPTHLASAEVPIKVDNRLFKGKTLEFGPWKTTELDRDWTQSSGITLGDVGQKRGKTGYRFTLNKAGAAHYHVECLTMAQQHSISMGSGSLGMERVLLQCLVFDIPDHIQRAAFMHKFQGPDTSTPVDYPSHTWTVQQEHRDQQGQNAFQPLGFVIRQDNEIIAALQTVNQNKVWLKLELPEAERDMAAALLSGIALYEKVYTDH